MLQYISSRENLVVLWRRGRHSTEFEVEKSGSGTTLPHIMFA